MIDEKYRIHYVRVQNNGDEPFKDMYDGVPITIPAHGDTNLKPDMAAHLFGYFDGATKEQMFKYTSKRQGWNTQEHLKRVGNKTVAEKMFDKFDIKQVAYRMVEDTPDLEAPIPADPGVPDELPTLPNKPPMKRGNQAA